MLSRSILSWLVLLTLATVTRSEHYHIVPVDSTDSCNEYGNGTCFTLEQLVQTDLLSGGDNLTLSFLPGHHVLTEQLLIRNFSHVQITCQNTSTTVGGFHSNGAIRFVSITKLNIERLGFVGANVEPQNSHQGFTIDDSRDVYIKDCYFSDFENHLVKITNTQTAKIESTLFNNNTGRALHVEADDVYITNSVFTRNDGGAVYIKSNNALINNTEFNYNSAESGGAVEVVSGTVVITWCTFTNNKAVQLGGAIDVSGSMSISNSELTNNSAGYSGGEISVYSGSVSISNTNITNNMASLNISQSNVTFTGMNIVSNNGRPIYAFNSRIEFNGPTTLSNNHGMFGGAISSDQSQIYINTEGVIITNNTATSGGGIFLRESTLFVNEPIKIYHNTAQDGGGIYAYSSRVEFQSVQMKNAFGNLLPPNKQSELAHNIAENGGGIHAISSTIKLTQSYVNIDSNTANTSGGGVYLQKSSKLYLFKTVEVYQYYRTQDRYVKLMINNNLAQYGGGIFVADDTQRSACGGRVTENVATHSIFAGCFIQTIKLYELGYSDLNYFNTFMTNNTATQSGADIYGGLLDRCTISQSAEYHISSNGSI